MKNKRIRLVAMLLTLAMAFSICAMPASAASSIRTQNTWAVGYAFTDTDDNEGYMWLSEASIRDILSEAFEEQGSSLDNVSDEDLADAMDEMKSELQNNGAVLYQGTLASNAYIGISQSKNGRTYWYSKEDVIKVGGDDSIKDASIDWNTGTMTYYTSDGTKGQIKAVDTLSGSNSGTLSKDSKSSGGSSNDSIGTVILLAGGAIVVGAVVYLYTHPAVVQNIKNFFTGNSAAQQPAQTVEASNEAAAENEAAVNEAAAENTVEVEQAA